MIMARGGFLPPPLRTQFLFSGFWLRLFNGDGAKHVGLRFRCGWLGVGGGCGEIWCFSSQLAFGNIGTFYRNAN